MPSITTNIIVYAAWLVTFSNLYFDLTVLFFVHSLYEILTQIWPSIISIIDPFKLSKVQPQIWNDTLKQNFQVHLDIT